MSSIHVLEMLGLSFLVGTAVVVISRFGAETASFIGPERESF
jgi:hypothetical protein